MLAKAFPNIDWLRKQADTSFADRRDLRGGRLPVAGWPSVIMNATASRLVRDNILGPLTIFSNRSGESVVTVGSKRVTLRPGVFFISNDQEHYTLEIGKQVTETANIHFGQAFMREAFRSMTADPNKMLDEPLEPIPVFHNRVLRSTPRFQRLLDSLVRPVKAALEEEQLLFELLSGLVDDETGLRSRQEQLTVLKSSTKVEILKRLLLATDYLHTVQGAQPDLDELARISCMSKFHFLRLFKIAFGQTPHQYLTNIKLEQAKDLLLHSQQEVRFIATSLGYKDASSFSRQFQLHTGVYPTQYRAQA